MSKQIQKSVNDPAEQVIANNTTGLEVAILNFSGIGLGYLYMRSWLRWGIHLAGTLVLLITATIFKASKAPWLWIMLWLIWLGWMVFDGWRQKSQVKATKLGLLKSAAISVAAIILIGGLWGISRIICNKVFSTGMTAFNEANYHLSLSKFDTVSNLCQLTFSPVIPQAEELRSQSALMLFAQESIEAAKYEDAINAYTSLINLYPQSEKNKAASNQLPLIHHQWANELSGEKSFAEADKQYMILLDQYGESSEAATAMKEIVDMYLEWAKTLRQMGEYEQAITKYYTIQKDYDTSIPTAELQDELANTYVEWADALSAEGDYSTAYEKYELVVRRYTSSAIAESAYEKSAANMFTWGEQLYSKEEYGEAAKTLEKLRNFYPNSDAKESTDQILPDVMLKYANQLGDRDDFINQATIIQKMIEYYPDSELTLQARSSISPALVKWGNLLIKEGRYLLAMEKFLLAQQEAQNNDILEGSKEGYHEALMALANDAGVDGQSMINKAKEDACAGLKTSAVGINLLANQPGSLLVCKGSLTVPKELKPTIPGTFRYVIEVEHNTIDIQICPYRSGSLMRFLHRQQQQTIITVRNTITGQIVFKQTFTGSTPPSCPATRRFSNLSEYEKGGPVSTEKIINWLSEILGY
ncbi:MAG: tetratricopeptide repeat protein [Anaerolineaceae bacterium]|nr:tetratricopeptide repeat protein [Anaerolineaceae bacterium]